MKEPGVQAQKVIDFAEAAGFRVESWKLGKDHAGREFVLKMDLRAGVGPDVEDALIKKES